MSQTQANGRDSVSHESGSQTAKAANEALVPAVKVIEDASGITLYADLPGVPRDQLVLNVESDTLTIEGEVSLNAPQGLQPLHVEVMRPRYRRVFTLSRELDAEQIVAEFQHGVLKLHIPKAAHAQPRKIAVNVH